MLKITDHRRNANQTVMEYYFKLTRVATIKKKADNNKCWQGCKGTEPYT